MQTRERYSRIKLDPISGISYYKILIFRTNFQLFTKIKNTVARFILLIEALRLDQHMRVDKTRQNFSFTRIIFHYLSLVIILVQNEEIDIITVSTDWWYILEERLVEICKIILLQVEIRIFKLVSRNDSSWTFCIQFQSRSW